jgi:Rad3-related DNA helicase
MRRATKLIIFAKRRGLRLLATSAPRLGDGVGKAARSPWLSVHGAPIEVALALREGLFSKFSPVILTSATLTTGSRSTSLIERLGLGAEPKIEGSSEPLPTVTPIFARNKRRSWMARRPKNPLPLPNPSSRRAL